MPSTIFRVTGKKKTLQVRRAGEQGTGNETRVIFASTGGRYKGVLLGVNEHTAQWSSFRSKEDAYQWLEITGQNRQEIAI